MRRPAVTSLLVPVLFSAVCALVAGVPGSAAMAEAGEIPRAAPAPRRLPLWVRSRPVLNATPSAVLAGTWAKSYGTAGSDLALVMRATSDGGFVLAGSTAPSVSDRKGWLFKIDGSGNVVWQKTYAAGSSVYSGAYATSDGGFAVEGYTGAGFGLNSLWLAKLNDQGAVQWQKSYAGSDATLFYAAPLTDGGFLVAGPSFSLTTMSSTLKVLRLDASGNITWQKEFSTEGAFIAFPMQLTDGSLLLDGTIVDPNTNDLDFAIMKLSATGTVQWAKRIGGAQNEAGGLVIPTSDGGYLLQGETLSAGAGGGADGYGDIVLIKLSSAGAVQWEKTYGGAGDEYAFGTQTSEGGFLLSGATNSTGAGKYDVLVMKLDASGNVTWQKTYGGGEDEDGFAMLDPTGGYLVECTTKSFGGGQEDLWLLKLDTSGNVQWQHAYGGPADERGEAMRLSDNSILLSGSTESYGAGSDDTWAAKLDSNGTMGSSCPFIHNTTVTPANASLTVASANLPATDLNLTVQNSSVTAGNMTVTTGQTSVTGVDVCTATPAFTATASADVTSGASPLTVAFTGSASNGTPPYSYGWSFGDGGSSTSQNPSHTYNMAGTYTVTLTVTDATSATAVDSHLSIAVSSGGGCTISCSATVPSTGTTGSPVSFAATASTSGCGTQPSYLWSFGDGVTSMQQNPSHAYAADGTYTWSLVVTAGTGIPCTKNGTITIGPQQGAQVLLASVAHLPGVPPTQWRTTVVVVNRSGGAASLTLTYYPYESGGSPVVKTYTLAAGATKAWQDILVELFGFASSQKLKGSVLVSSNVPVVVTSRTFNQTASGTFGQYYPAITAGQALSAGQQGVLAQVTKNAAFRTNVGVLALTDTSVTLKAYGASGTQIGNTVTKTLTANRYWQADDFLGSSFAGAGNQDLAYVVVQVSSGTVWVYASVVDNVTGDPTTIPVLVP
jgi:PKD repeat protein